MLLLRKMTWNNTLRHIALYTATDLGPHEVVENKYFPIFRMTVRQLMRIFIRTNRTENVGECVCVCVLCDDQCIMGPHGIGTYGPAMIGLMCKSKIKTFKAKKARAKQELGKRKVEMSWHTKCSRAEGKQQATSSIIRGEKRKIKKRKSKIEMRMPNLCRSTYTSTL